MNEWVVVVWFINQLEVSEPVGDLTREVTHYCKEINSRSQWKLPDEPQV